MEEDKAFKQMPWQDSPYLNTDSLDDVLSGEESPYWRDVQIETLPPDDENMWADFGEVFNLKTKSQTFTPTIAESPMVLSPQIHSGDSPITHQPTEKPDDGNCVTQPVQSDTQPAPSTSANYAYNVTKPRSYELVTATTPVLPGDASKRQSPKRRHRRQRARLSKVTSYDLDSLLLAETESDLSAETSNYGQAGERDSKMSTNSLSDGRVCELFNNDQAQLRAADMPLELQTRDTAGRPELREGDEEDIADTSRIKTLGNCLERHETSGYSGTPASAHSIRVRQSLHPETEANNGLTPEEELTVSRGSSIVTGTNNSDLTGSLPMLLPQKHMSQDSDSRNGSQKKLKDNELLHEVLEERATVTVAQQQTTAQRAGNKDKFAVTSRDVVHECGRLRNILDILTCTSCKAACL